MRRQAAWVLAVLAIGAWTASPLWAGRSGGTGKDTGKKLTEGKPEDHVFKFIAAKPGQFNGKPGMIITVQSPLKQQTLTMAAEGDSLGKNFKKDDYVKATIVPVTVGSSSAVLCKSMTAYQLKPGEAEPDGYVFVEVTDVEVSKDKTVPVVVLSKFEEKINAAIPQVRSKEGGMVSDPKISDVTDNLKKDDSVTATVIPGGQLGTLKSIAKFIAPVQGEFVKTVHDKGVVTAVEVKVGGESKSLQVGDGKAAADPKLLATLGMLKAGDAVDVKIRDEEGKSYLAGIAKTKKVAAAG